MDKLLGRIDKTVSHLAVALGASDIYAEASNKVVSAIHGKKLRVSALELVKGGSVVQFKSRLTKHTMQILKSASDDKMIVNVWGGEGKEWFNASWAVQEISFNRFRFHNSYNFLRYTTSGVSVVHIPPHLTPPKDAEWRLFTCYDDLSYLLLESVDFPSTYVCFDKSGVIDFKNSKNRLYHGSHFSVVVLTDNDPTNHNLCYSNGANAY